MKKIIFTLILITAIFQNSFSQAVCISEEDDYEDLSEIALAKCTTDTKKTLKKQNFTKKFIIKERKLIKDKSKRRRNKKRRVIKLNNNTLLNTVAVNKAKSNINNLILSINETKKIVSIIDVDEVPSFISNKDNNSFEKFNTRISEHITKHLTYPTSNIIHQLKGIVKVNFIIDTEGEVKSIKATCNNSDVLEEEAIRIISLLPKFIPGKHQGNKVNVFYNFHMQFI